MPMVESKKSKAQDHDFNTDSFVIKIDSVRELQATKVKRNGHKRFIRYGTRSFVWSKKTRVFQCADKTCQGKILHRNKKFLVVHDCVHISALA